MTNEGKTKEKVEVEKVARGPVLTVADPPPRLVARQTGNTLVGPRRVLTLLPGTHVGVRTLVDVWNRHNTCVVRTPRGTRTKVSIKDGCHFKGIYVSQVYCGTWGIKPRAFQPEVDPPPLVRSLCALPSHVCVRWALKPL